MPLLHVTTGKENNRTSSAQINAFAHDKGKEAPLFACKSKAEFKDKIQQVGMPQHYQARQGIKAGIGGSWVAGDYNITEGMLIKLSVTRSDNSGRLHAQAVIQMREAAALRRLKVRLALTRHSTVEEAIIEGRFDVLTFEEAKIRGLQVPDHFERMFAPIMFNRIVTTEVVEPEREPMKVIEVRRVQTEEGKEIVVQARKRKRSLDT